MEIREFLRFVRRWLWLILLAMAVGAVGAFLFSHFQPPVFKARTVLLVDEGDVGQATDYARLQASERLAQSYVERLKSPDVLEEAAQNLQLTISLERLQEDVAVRLIGETHLIELTVEHRDPATARILAREIPAVFSKRNIDQQLERYTSSRTRLEAELAALSAELDTAETALRREQGQTPSDPALLDSLQDDVLRLRATRSRLLESYEQLWVAEASSLNNIVVDSAARVAPDPVRPRTLVNVLLSTAMGATAALSLAFLVEYMDETVKAPEEVQKLLNTPVLGAVAEIDTSRSQDALPILQLPLSPSAEAYRQLRTNLIYSLDGCRRNSLLVTSPNPGEGKTTTAANLALALVQAGKHVILVDADLRKPALHQLFGLDNRRGLADLLATVPVNPEECLHLLLLTPVDGLHLLPTGPLPPNPAELLSSEAMSQVAACLVQQADYVIYDSSPVLAVTDAALLSRAVGTTLMVASAGTTTAEELRTAWSSLQAVESLLVGVVLNRISPHAANHSYYYYHYCRDGDGKHFSRQVR